MNVAKKVLTWCALFALVGFVIGSFGWVAFPKWAEFLAAVTIVTFMAWNTLDTERERNRRLSAGDEAQQLLVDVKKERDWVVSCAVMYGSGRLLNIPSESVLPTLERLGKRLPAGNTRLQHQVVIVHTVGSRTLAYALAARPGSMYPVLEGQLAYEVSPIDFVSCASEELIDDWFQSGLLGELRPACEDLLRQLSEQYWSTQTLAQKVRDLVESDKVVAQKASPASST